MLVIFTAVMHGLGKVHLIDMQEHDLVTLSYQRNAEQVETDTAIKLERLRLCGL